MPDRSSKRNRRNVGQPNAGSEIDSEVPAQNEDATVQEPVEKNPAAVALGRLGGQKGGVARAKKLSQARRSEIARRAAVARWGKRKE